MKILITDEHAVVRQGYAGLLISVLPDSVSILETDSGERAVALYRSEKPDLVIMDINLPGISGIEAVRRICSWDSAAAVLMFSMYDEIPVLEQAMEAGAKGYITKSCDPEVLIAAVKKVSSGQRFIQSDLLMGMAFNKNVPGERFSNMTQREFEIFVNLARGLSTECIANQMCLSSKTVANYSSQLKSKLQVSNTAELVHLAIQNGLIKIGQFQVDRETI